MLGNAVMNKKTSINIRDEFSLQTQLSANRQGGTELSSREDADGSAPSHQCPRAVSELKGGRGRGGGAERTELSLAGVYRHHFLRTLNCHYKILVSSVHTFWFSKVTRAGMLRRQPPEQLVVFPPPAPESVAKAPNRLEITRL